MKKKKSVFIEWLLWTQIFEKAELSPNPTSWHPKAVWPWVSYLTFVRLTGKWGPEALLLGAVGAAAHGPVQNINCDSGLGSPAAVVHPWYPNLWMEHSYPKPNPCHHLFFFSIEVWLIYNAMLISAVQQSDSFLHIYTLKILHCDLSQDIKYSSLCYNSRTLLFIHSIYNSLHVLIPTSQVIPFLTPLPLAT